MSELFFVKRLNNFNYMSGKHIRKYLQKYYIFFFSATLLIILAACSTTKKIPAGEYLLTHNSYLYTDNRDFSSELPDYVIQKPNKKQLFLLPVGLWFYNKTNPKYDTILNEYMTYPSEIRTQKLRDSLFLKYGHPEYKGKSLFKQRVLHNLSEAPVILNPSKTAASADNIRKRLVYRGFWDANISYKEHMDSAAKKAQVEYQITHNLPTHISEYYYHIPDKGVKQIYESVKNRTIVRAGDRLDQTKLEDEAKRITQLMRDRGYYKFNASNEEIYFTADTLKSRKNVPLILEVHGDSLRKPYKKTTIGDIKVYIQNSLNENTAELRKDSVFGISFYQRDGIYKNRALWRAVILKKGTLYQQYNLDLTKRNLTAMNNFYVNPEIDLRKGSDSILDVSYRLVPLPKYEFRITNDLTYSQILNFGIAPAIDLTTRNIFGGAENLTTSISGTFGSVKNQKNTDKRVIAYELSAQANLNFPRLLLPFRYHKLIPKRYSPTSSITLGTSVQDNIGLGRIGFNAGLNYYANVNDIITHRLSLFNTQFSLTRNKERYYDYFPGEKEIVRNLQNTYFETHADVGTQYNNGTLNIDEVNNIIMQDGEFVSSFVLSSTENSDRFNSFMQSIYNKERQTEDVLITSMIYNFIYNEIGKKQYENPFYFSAKLEIAGNLLGFLSRKETDNLATGNSKMMFGIPYSQFIKFDIDVRKYIAFANRSTLVFRQFVGLGIPYGNSTGMPFIRSYFNGGSNDIRAWRVFGGLGPSDSQADQKIRMYVMDNMKLTTNVEYRMPFTSMFEGALFMDAGNIWSVKSKSGLDDQFKFSKFLSQMGVGTGFGLRINIAYMTLRLDAAYKVYNPNIPSGSRWVISKWQPLKPVINFAFGYPF